MKEYNKELCDERHRKLEETDKILFVKHEALDECIRKKFNAIMFGIFTTLLTVIGSLITFIIMKHG